MIDQIVLGRLSVVVGPDSAKTRKQKIGGDPPQWIQIFPDGEYECSDGTYITDEKSREAVIAYFEERGNELVIDYEHQTLTGEKAPAAGWIKELDDRGAQGLWARVEWTAQAEAYLRSGEYRYDSPVFEIEKDTNRVIALHHMALTNWPGSNNRTPLTEQIAASVRARRKQSAREGVMDFRDSVRWWLDLPMTTTNNEMRTHLQRLIDSIPADDKTMAEKAEGAETTTIAQAVGFVDAATIEKPEAPKEVVAAKALLDELELPETATLAEAHARIGDIKTRTSPEEVEQLRAENKTLKERVGQLEATTEEEKLTQLIKSNASRITPAKEAWVRSVAKKHGLEHATEVVRNMPEVLPDPTPAKSEVVVEEKVGGGTKREDGRPVNEKAREWNLKVKKHMATNNIADYEAASDDLRKKEATAAK